MREARLLLDEGVAVDDVYKLAYRLDYLLSQLGDRRRGQPAEDIWQTLDKAASLHLVDDVHVDLRYLVVRNGDVKAVLGAAHKALAHVDRKSALLSCDRATSSAEKIAALYRLGVAALDLRAPDAGTTRVLTRALSSDESDVAVRHAAIVAIGYLGWPKLRALLASVQKEDAAASVRKDAALMLEVLVGRDASR